MNAEATVTTYYDALRAGEPLYPFFVTDDPIVKFGITERLAGYEAVKAGLREQTRTTDDWTVESHDLTVTERGGVAWFSDDVRMAWYDTEDADHRDHETRWSGTLARNEEGWRFVGMHVSIAGEL